MGRINEETSKVILFLKINRFFFEEHRDLIHRDLIKNIHNNYINNQFNFYFFRYSHTLEIAMALLI